MADPRYPEHLKERNKKYSARANFAYKTLRSAPGILAPKPQGAFYISAVFREGVLNGAQSLSVENERAERLLEKVCQGAPADKRFAYYLMASTGICVVPLSGFNSGLSGFRATLLETDKTRFEWIFETLAAKIKEYLAS